MDEPDWVLLERVAVGQGTDADRVAVEQWIGEDPERQRLFESLARIAEGTRRLNIGPPFDPTSSLRRARSRLHRSAAPHRWSQMAIAAGLILCFGIALTVGLSHREREAPQQSYATKRGQRATVRLDDGTQIVLAPASHLTVIGRKVTLDGEAFFTVMYDSHAPFVVRAGRVVATDLGTQFDVRAYPEDSTVRVAVEEGRVALTATDSAPPVALVQGDVATLGRVGRAAVAHGLDPAGISAWTGGRLEFHGTPTGEAVVALSRWYDLDLRLEDASLATVPFTASFRDEPVNEVLHIVAVTLGARVHWRGRTVFLRKK